MPQTLTGVLLIGAGGVLLWLWTASVWGRGGLAQIVGAVRQAPAVSAAARLWLLSLPPLGACLLVLGILMVPGFRTSWIPAVSMLFVGVSGHKRVTHRINVRCPCYSWVSPWYWWQAWSGPSSRVLGCPPS